MVVSSVTLDDQTAAERRSKALALYEQVQAWPHWEEVYLNCVKESPMSYEAFAQAVQAGDSSRQAFERAMQASQMSRDQFACYLPAFQQFVTLCAVYPNIGMLSDGADQVWHAFMLITDRYAQFCRDVIGQPIDHLPCSLYELYGVALSQAESSCVSSCLPSTCKGSGGGGGCTKSDRSTTDAESITQGILVSRMAFLSAYQEVFQQQPDPAIWNQLAR
ncbi:MAG TPA: hypothetical protein VFV38_24940 [Ktedonobacteraceae bacterium]|nr:hypothetical protein [Ktedonobacteraceae bacterium]